MRLKPLSLGLALLFSFGALAQDVPKADLYVGYSFFRFNPTDHQFFFNNNNVGNFALSSFNANGGQSTFAWNFNKHFAMEAEFGLYSKANVDIVQFHTNAWSYLFGPRISLSRGR